MLWDILGFSSPSPGTKMSSGGRLCYFSYPSGLNLLYLRILSLQYSQTVKKNLVVYSGIRYDFIWAFNSSTHVWKYFVSNSMKTSWPFIIEICIRDVKNGELCAAAIQIPKTAMCLSGSQKRAIIIGIGSFKASLIKTIDFFGSFQYRNSSIKS